jgi:Domain of unknown function (DUF397)
MDMKIRWRKSTYSSGNGGNCIEVAAADRVLVRDTKQHGTGPLLRFTPGAWRRFTDQVKRSLASDRVPLTPVGGTLVLKSAPYAMASLGRQG